MQGVIVQEQGRTNDMIFCDTCNTSVHIFCFGQTRSGDAFDRTNVGGIEFTCEQCEAAAEGVARESMVCALCPVRTGLMRKLSSGGWVHPACILYNPRVTYPKEASGHQWTRLCSQQSGCALCFKNEFVVDAPKRNKKPGQLSVCCSLPDCPAPSSSYLLECGGRGTMCMGHTHVSCAQRPGSGWHLKLHETDDSSQVEVLCKACNDLYLDVSGSKPKYKLSAFSKPLTPACARPYVDDEAYATAAFTFQDWAHGFNGGLRRANERLGGLCTGACDSDGAARAVYLASFINASPSLDNLNKMGTDPRVARASNIIMCGFCCKPFSPCGDLLGFDDERFGDNYLLMTAALKGRRDKGVFDPCLICENVPNLLSFITPEQLALESLGYHCKLFVVSGAHFRCANMRVRVVYARWRWKSGTALSTAQQLFSPLSSAQLLSSTKALASRSPLRLVGFLDPQHLANFTPPPPQSIRPTPIVSALKEYEISSDLYLRKPTAGCDFKRCHVVGRGYPMGAHSLTSSYGSYNSPGTLIATNPKFDAQ